MPLPGFYPQGQKHHCPTTSSYPSADSILAGLFTLRQSTHVPTSVSYLRISNGINMLSFLYCSNSSEYLQVVVDAILSSSDQVTIFGTCSKKNHSVYPNKLRALKHVILCWVLFYLAEQFKIYSAQKFIFLMTEDIQTYS